MAKKEQIQTEEIVKALDEYSKHQILMKEELMKRDKANVMDAMGSWFAWRVLTVFAGAVIVVGITGAATLLILGTGGTPNPELSYSTVLFLSVGLGSVAGLIVGYDLK